MIGNRSRLKNFVKKFIETVRFRNDHFGAIICYEDYVIGDSVISKLYYVEGLGHNLFSIRKFCDSDLEVAFKKHPCYVRNEDGVDLLKDAPSTSHSPSFSEVRPPISHQGVAAGPTIEDNPFAQAKDDPFVNVFAPETSSKELSLGDVRSVKSNQVIQPHNHLGK
uniref:Integrase, catalytic region, zinc finger, CCHC-type, peptidase aspartic, catalytic n=1 Tax=Tanacetum cinerariifolium TaxID=118510 RepID=A0A699K031_TANCI|nr:integrase, catalytic region, zinc finger, CCHC-type, peptidase aspartic, catalytic [Tanacetum cinerariifolium]